MINIGVIFKPNLKEKEQVLKMLNIIEKNKKVNFYPLEVGQAYMLDKNENRVTARVTPTETRLSTLNFLLCFGGDGTMLSSKDYSLKYNAPVLGVNLGRLGFLTDCSLNELDRAIEALRNNKFRIESRMILDIKIYREKKLVHSDLALNDAVIYKGNESKLITLKLYSNKQLVYNTRSDGIVVSTPTGTTAYSLSAGGPIIAPAMQALIVTPLNPHILTVRPMVFAHDETLEIIIAEDHHVYLQIDGKNICELKRDDKIIIKKHKQPMQFIKLSQKTFYKILRRKLHMGKL